MLTGRTSAYCAEYKDSYESAHLMSSGLWSSVKDGWVHKVLMLPLSSPHWLSLAQSEPTRVYMALYGLSTDAASPLCTLYTAPLITIHTSGSNRPLSLAHPHAQ